MDLENIMLSKIRQTEKVQNHMILLICGIIKLETTNEQTRKMKTHGHRQQCGGCQKEGGGKGSKG